MNSQSVSATSQPLTLREGQMFHGQIKQLYPGQMAEVQIGGQRLMAKLEVPMKAGDAYYFQVKSVTPELQIRVVSGPLQATGSPTKQLLNLLESLQLPKSQEMQSILSHFLKQKLPITRDILLQAEALMKTVQPSVQNEAMNAIQKLVEVKLPLNTVNFNSVLGVEIKEGLHKLLSTFKTAVVEETGIQAQRKESLLATLGEAGRITSTAAERALVSGAMLKLLNDDAPREERFQVLQLLKNSGIMPPNATLANLQTVIDSLMTERASEAGQLRNMIQNDPVLQQSLKVQLIGLFEEMKTNRPSEMSSAPASEPISKTVMRAVAEHIQSTPFRMEDSASITRLLIPESVQTKMPELYRTMEQSPLPLAKELIQGAQSAVELAVDGKVIKDAMQALFKSLGFNYEAGMLNRNVDIGNTMEMLKPQLVALLQDSTISPALREATEAVIARMNGTFIQSGESGLNQQIVMQLPLEFLGKKIDATIHWNGRKKDDGKIDADFARILFYLELESIQKTVIDMQVQNRVVTVTIFNDQIELRTIGNKLQEKLRTGLESVNYRLSGVTFKQFEEEKNESKRRNELLTDHRGVDFRI
ncbi:hypothetical protein [Sporosarcina sp. ACRSL]|uniref:hypothetical protein n=1 Tax=Sporosarcina sp. ACRSL TaxID=2918215 RepID=UPI001EF672A9|nr:hypothetical protein [Sporosarcina sp. ACRSL]